MALAEVFEAVAGPDAPVEFTAYDGSHAGKAGSPVKITVRSPVAVAYLAQAPGRARAGPRLRRRAPRRRRRHVRGAGQDDQGPVQQHERSGEAAAAAGPRRAEAAAAPDAAAAAGGQCSRRWLAGRLHSKSRDAQAISHHYDVSNRFYEWVLGPTMAYTCACYPTEDATLEEAQTYKFDLVARKLGAASRACACSTSAAAGAAW